jgi:hypothetical protein
MIGEYDFATSGDFILPGIIVTQDNAAAMLQMATDMEKDTQNVPFDMSLEDIIASYMNN